jgi:hypothetical protein
MKHDSSNVIIVADSTTGQASSSQEAFSPTSQEEPPVLTAAEPLKKGRRTFWMNNFHAFQSYLLFVLITLVDLHTQLESL